MENFNQSEYFPSNEKENRHTYIVVNNGYL